MILDWTWRPWYYGLKTNMKIHNHLYHDVISSTSMFKFIKKSVINIWYMAFITFCNKCMVCGIYQKSVINIRFMSMILVKFCNKCMVYAIQVWGQIHWNIFKYKYFWMYYKYKYFSNEKNKFIVFPLVFILTHTLHNITASTRFVTSIYEFFVDYTWGT